MDSVKPFGVKCSGQHVWQSVRFNSALATEACKGCARPCKVVQVNHA